MNDTSHDKNDFGTALSYSARAPLTWELNHDLTTTTFDNSNEQCLRTILNLSEHHSVDVNEEFAALERKVDITLEMVATLLRSSIDMPEAKTFQLGAHEISWQSNDSLPELGVFLNVVIYLHELYPKALILPGQVKFINVQECVVELAPQTTEVQQLLEKFIFLHHRRAIAQAKKF